MTPSNFSFNALARRASSLPYTPAARAGRTLAPSEGKNSAPLKRTALHKANGDSPQTSDATDPISELLHSTVLKVWQEEQLSEAHQTEAGPAALANDEASATEKSAEFRTSLPTWKRVLDVTFILLTSPFWLPLMLLLMLAVRLSSAGPIFYRQERIGYCGRTFMIYKFRSMKVDAETDVHEAHLERLMRNSAPMAKLDHHGDPRILPWGRILRATGLDELPQIFNVLRGEMSMVGPRPCTVHEFSRYANWQRARVNAFPGLTGYWQVNGKNKTTFSEMIEMDIFYGKNLSLALDLKIILQTIPALLGQTMETMSRRPQSHASGPVSSEINSSQI